MAETLGTLSVIFGAAAAICFAAAIFFLIFFRIPALIEELSGQTARKSIAGMREVRTKNEAGRFYGRHDEKLSETGTEGVTELLAPGEVTGLPEEEETVLLKATDKTMTKEEEI